MTITRIANRDGATCGWCGTHFATRAWTHFLTTRAFCSENCVRADEREADLNELDEREPETETEIYPEGCPWQY